MLVFSLYSAEFGDGPVFSSFVVEIPVGKANLV